MVAPEQPFPQGQRLSVHRFRVGQLAISIQSIAEVVPGIGQF